MDPTLRSWLTTPVTWEPFQSQDGRGKPVYGTAVDLVCFMEGSRQVIRNVKGEEVVSNWTLYFDDSQVASMTEKDRLTLPSGEQPAIIRMTPVYNERGEVDHYEVNV